MKARGVEFTEQPTPDAVRHRQRIPRSVRKQRAADPADGLLAQACTPGAGGLAARSMRTTRVALGWAMFFVAAPGTSRGWVRGWSRGGTSRSRARRGRRKEGDASKGWWLVVVSGEAFGEQDLFAGDAGGVCCRSVAMRYALSWARVRRRVGIIIPRWVLIGPVVGGSRISPVGVANCGTNWAPAGWVS